MDLALHLRDMDAQSTTTSTTNVLVLWQHGFLIWMCFIKRLHGNSLEVTLLLLMKYTTTTIIIVVVVFRSGQQRQDFDPEKVEHHGSGKVDLFGLVGLDMDCLLLLGNFESCWPSNIAWCHHSGWFALNE